MYNRYNPQYKASSDGCFAVAGVTYTRSNPTKPVLKQNLHVFHVARASLPGCLTKKHLCGTAEMSSVIFRSYFFLRCCCRVPLQCTQRVHKLCSGKKFSLLTKIILVVLSSRIHCSELSFIYQKKKKKFNIKKKKGEER